MPIPDRVLAECARQALDMVDLSNDNETTNTVRKMNGFFFGEAHTPNGYFAWNNLWLSPGDLADVARRTQEAYAAKVRF